MGFLSKVMNPTKWGDLFEREKMEAPQRLQEPWQIEMQQYLANLAKPGAAQALTSAGQAFPGSLTTPYEDIRLGLLQDYLKSPSPLETDVYKNATAALSGLLDTSGLVNSLYGADRASTMYELEQAKNRIMGATGARGRTPFAGGLTDELTDLNAQVVNALGQRRAGYEQFARQLGLSAIPLATQTLGWAEALPQTRFMAGDTLSALPFTRDYAEWIRQQQALQQPLQTATQFATYTPEYYQPGYEPSDFERFILPILQAAAAGAGKMAAGG